MDYTVEFDSELLKQFPQEEHFMYKEAISHKVTEYLEHNFFRIKPVRTRSAKGIYEMKVKINKKNYRIAFAFIICQIKRDKTFHLRNSKKLLMVFG
ncbi:hypothetical protein R6K88_12265, partial [Enterococcus faecium]|uniref:hypothetical protein n=1 Tax=Enterococcus faecium TaxID=1352 RepID=UPI00296AA285